MKIYQWDKIYGWAGGVKIKINDHLSPAEAEIRAGLGNMMSLDQRVGWYRVQSQFLREQK